MAQKRVITLLKLIELNVNIWAKTTVSGNVCVLKQKKVLIKNPAPTSNCVAGV